MRIKPNFSSAAKKIILPLLSLMEKKQSRFLKIENVSLKVNWIKAYLSIFLLRESW